MIGALLSAVLLTAPRPAHALDPARVFQPPPHLGAQGANPGKQRAREPGRAERRKDYRPNQYRSNQYRSERKRPDQLRPDRSRSDRLGPNQLKDDRWSRERSSRPAPRRSEERGPSVLYPENEGDRRALQQLMRHDRARRAVEQGTIRPLEEIRDRVQSQFNGRIVGLELYENPNRGVAGWVYDVRVLTREGNVMAVEMDARTGRVMSVRGKR